MKLEFHWRLLQGGETPNMTRAGEGMRRETGLPDLGRQVEFCRRAAQCGITGLLTDIGATKADPIPARGGPRNGHGSRSNSLWPQRRG